ncbi:Alpha/beta hydrolase fold-1 [Aspergillus cavernicola]|uniref:Alpha/beta hydrolase fold-1 n=1 Tax=Aspergillus cavernicola TaxID=176166 RepID=A0ABR4J185_9EURO
MQKPIIFVIPGAYHRPFHYRKIVDPLRAQGYEVICLDHVVCGDDVDPEATFFDDAANIQEKLIPLLDEGRKAIIVSHSYGSLPTTAVVEGQTMAERSGRGLKGGIVGVINIAGFTFPVRNKNIMGEDNDIPLSPFQLIKDGIVYLEEGGKPLIFTDLSPEQMDIEWNTMFKKQSLKSFHTFPRYIESEYRCSKTYILCEKDETVPPPFQEQMAGSGGFDIVRLESGHSPHLSVPEDVVAVVTKVAETSG